MLDDLIVGASAPAGRRQNKRFSVSLTPTFLNRAYEFREFHYPGLHVLRFTPHLCKEALISFVALASSPRRLMGGSHW